MKLALRLQIPSTGTDATSQIAEFVTEQNEQGYARLQESLSLGICSSGVIGKLYEVAEECGEPGWDGEQAAPVTEATFGIANRFLCNLPLGTEAPTVSADPDGAIAFEWYKSPKRVLSISIDASGFLHYAALLGPRKLHGREPYFGQLPEVIGNIISELSQK
jgi:hypothetical protein